MSRNHSFDYTPQTGRIADVIQRGFNPDDLRLVYNEPADELVVFLLPNTESSVALDTSENVYLLLDPRTEDVAGFQFDNFMSDVVFERPQLLALASLAGVPPSMIERVRDRIGEDRVRRAAAEAALRDLIGDVPVNRS